MSTVDKSTTKILSIVRDIVCEAIRANSKTDVAELTKDLLAVFGFYEYETPKDMASTEHKEIRSQFEEFVRTHGQRQQHPKVQPLEFPVNQVQTIFAPFPPTVSGEDEEYNPLKACSVLPSFTELPFKFCKEYSAIKTDGQTVVMSSAHYSDLIAVRDQLAERNATVAAQVPKLEPVGMDVDGEIKPIEELSYDPVAAWFSAIDPKDIM